MYIIICLQILSCYNMFAAGSLFSSLDGVPFVVNERLKPPPKVGVYLDESILYIICTAIQCEELAWSCYAVLS